MKTDVMQERQQGHALEDGPIRKGEMRAAEASREWLQHNEPISYEKVLAEFGLTSGRFRT